MKTNLRTMKTLSLTLVLLGSLTVPGLLRAQQARPNGKEGLDMFETTKFDTTPYNGPSIRVGGFFAQDYQMLTQSNSATYKTTSKTDSTNANQLASLVSGFNLAEANFTLDAILADGISTNVTLYLSSRHHNETWVKGGYLQLDKLGFMHSDMINDLMKNLTFKVGAMDVDYGDAHYRRTDGGNEMHNAFVENYIMDDFATEVGLEAYYRTPDGLLVMGGITDGQLNPTLIASTKVDAATNQPNQYDPAFHFKLGYDKQFTPDLRFRITGSYYGVKSTSSNTLFGGDRTGSHYFFAMENTEATSSGNPFSGRFNPSFSEQVSTFMVNPFIKVSGLEFFGTYELAQGRTITETDMRKATQLAGELIYRFGSNEDFWVGARYNTLTATLPPVGTTTLPDITINRIVGSVGWFMTSNVMAKVEYVTQDYKNFAATDIRSGGNFKGMMIEAALGF